MWFRPLLLFALVGSPVCAKTLLLLPVMGEVEKSEDIGAVDQLFREAVQNGYAGQVRVAPSDSAHACGERDCAGPLAVKAKADEVIFANLRRLGAKWIFSATIMDAGGGNLFNQRATAQNLEDLESITKRVSDALLSRKSIEQVASIDNITEKEETKEPARRRSLYAGGFSLGYLYPVGGSYTYMSQDYTYDPITGSSYTYAPQSYSQMIRLAWLNTWEFRQNMMVGFDVVWSAPHVIGADINYQYLVKPTDFTPFVGGGLGLHYVRGDDSAASDKRNSGPALNAQAGMVLFRTYDIHILARAQYQVILNSDLDHGPSFDVGVVYQRREKEHSSGWGTFWKYYLIGAVVLSIVGATVD